MRTVIAILLAGLLGCASIVSKSVYPVTFESNPSGAQILVTDSSGNRIYDGTTPTTLTLSATKGFFNGQSYTIRAAMEGHGAGRATLRAGLDGWYIGNILIGGLIGMLLVDPATGAMWKLDERVVVNLGRPSSSLDRNHPSLEIVTIDKIPEEFLPYMARVN